MKKIINNIEKTFEKFQNSDYAVALMLLIIISLMHYIQILMNATVHDIYRRLYYIPILIGASKNGIKGGAIIALFATLTYLPHFFILSQHDINITINLVLEIVMFYFIGVLVGYFIEQQNENQIILREQIEQLETLESETRSLIETVPMVVLSTDDTLHVNRFNRLAALTFNMIEMDKDISDWLISIGISKAVVEDLIAGNKNHFDKDVQVDVEGQLKTYACSLAPLHDNKGNVHGLVMAMSDITKIMIIEKQLGQADKLSSLGLMASGIAHEIRNPIAIIRAVIQQLTSESILEDQEGLSIIIEEIDRVNKLIQDMLTFAKPEESVKEAVDLMQIIEYVAQFSRNYAEQHRVRIKVNAGGQFIVFADRKKLIQALLNIIVNGIQAIEHDGTILITAVENKKQYEITITDDGCGIDEQGIKYLFDPFFTTKDSGTGLGLAMSQSIIMEHGGQIKVKSKLGSGTEIKIELPKQEGHNEDNTRSR